jgi:P27 family predicted phage terminase small subunit
MLEFTAQPVRAPMWSAQAGRILFKLVRFMSRRTSKPAIINAPSYLVDGDVLEKWNEIISKLQSDGLLRHGDEDTLASYCILFCRWRKAEKIVADKGEVLKTVNGNLIQNPYLAISNRALKDMNLLAAQIGLTPASRSKITTDVPDEKMKKRKPKYGY